MTSRHLVDPELAPILDSLPSIPLTHEIVQQVRAMATTQRFPNLPASPGIEVTEHFVPGPAASPQVRVLLYRPTTPTTPKPALLLLHGGGYIIGSPEQEDSMIKSIVSSVDCIALSVDYRLAPEHPYPAPLEDCYAALQWLHSHADELHIDPTRIALMGSSAGGGLAAALALLARDRQEIPLAFQLLIAPMIDDRTVTTSDPHPYTGEFVWTRDNNRFGWTSYLGQQPGTPDILPYAAPARAENLAGLPPTFINVGAIDLFLDEDLDYARRLTRAGVPTELHIYPGAYHGYRMTPDSYVTRTAHDQQVAALKRALTTYG
jgi:acetyl esterase/lipase